MMNKSRISGRTKTLFVGAAFVGAVLATLPAVAAEAERDAEVTFTKHVAPILQRSCQHCHRPDAVAPMSLLTYEEARPWAARKPPISA